VLRVISKDQVLISCPRYIEGALRNDGSALSNDGSALNNCLTGATITKNTMLPQRGRLCTS
jgi:hypothetical protein